MIAILGQTQDDILYFTAKMRIERSEDIFGKTKAYFGHLFSDEVVLAAVGEGNEFTAMLTSVIIDRYDPYLVFSIGTCVSFQRELRQGDILIADRVYLANVDFTKEHPLSYGQLPGEAPLFVGDLRLSDQAERESYLVSSRYIQRGYRLSGSSFPTEKEEVDSIIRPHFLSQEVLKAYDSGSGGILLAASAKKVPVVTIKSVCFELGNLEQRLSYRRKGLEAMPTIGKIVSRTLLDQGDAI